MCLVNLCACQTTKGDPLKGDPLLANRLLDTRVLTPAPHPTFFPRMLFFILRRTGALSVRNPVICDQPSPSNYPNSKAKTLLKLYPQGGPVPVRRRIIILQHVLLSVITPHLFFGAKWLCLLSPPPPPPAYTTLHTSRMHALSKRE